MAKVLIPTPLRQFTGKQDTVSVSGGTVGEVLSALTSQYPDLRKQIFTDEGKVRSFVNVYLNDEDIRYLGKDATPTKDGDTLSLVPSIAGGSTLAAPAEEVDAFERRDPAVQPAPDHSRGRHRRAEEAQGRQGAAGRHRRAGRAAGAVPGGRRDRQNRAGRFRHGGFHEPAAAGDPLHAKTWAARSSIRRRRRCRRSIRTCRSRGTRSR